MFLVLSLSLASCVSGLDIPTTQPPSNQDNSNVNVSSNEEERITWECQHCGHRINCPADHPPGACSICGESNWKMIEKITVSTRDRDRDWISDRLELELGTDPFNLDTDGDGIDDFNELYVYPHLLDPLDPSDVQEFLEKIPEVKAKGYLPFAGDTNPEISIRDEKGRIIGSSTKYIDVPKRDPLVQWYAENTYIEWGETPKRFLPSDKTNYGRLMAAEELFYQEYGWSEIEGTAYFLTHNRKGVCGDYAWHTAILFDLKGYPARTMRSEFETAQIIYIDGKPVNPKGHVWTEVIINGEIYVIDLGLVMPQGEYYQAHTDWKIFINYLNNWPK